MRDRRRGRDAVGGTTTVPTKAGLDWMAIATPIAKALDR